MNNTILTTFQNKWTGDFKEWWIL